MKPIFIFGAERSGTTLLGSILGSHSVGVATPEAHFVTQVYRVAQVQSGEVDLEDALARIKQHFRFKLWNLDTTMSDLEPHPPISYAALILALVGEYAAAAGRPDAQVWVDHTPSNNRSAALLAELFPEAQFIHLVRDGRAVVASIKSLNWGTHSARTITQNWVVKVGHGLAAESYLNPERCLRVRYEDLVERPEQTLRSVCAFAGLPYEPAMLSGTGFAVPGYTQKQHQLVGKLPDAKRIDAWAQTLSQRDIETCEHVSENMLVYLGYTPVFGYRAKIERPLERYRALLADLLWYRWVDRFKRQRKRNQSLKKLRLPKVL